MAAAEVDSASYAENLRKSLIEDLFEGQDLGELDGQDIPDELDITDLVGASGALSLQDIDKDLEEFQDHEVIRGILEQGRVLKEYARDIDDKLRTAELESIQDYIQESDNMVALHEQIKSCDTILSNMEQLLGKFQSELGKVSEEIRQLQVQSQTMSTKLKNRRAAEQKLGTFIEHLTVSEEMVNSILEKEVNEDYLEYLLALDKKLKFVHEDELAQQSQAKRDLEPALEKLRIKALTKVRDFMMAKVYLLKRPKTNVQIIQQSTLLKYKYFMRFLRQHGTEVYEEIRSEYISCLSKILAQHFKTYLAALERMQAQVAGPNDLLGSLLEEKSGLSALFSKSSNRGNTEAAFALGERASILVQGNKPALIPHMAEFEGKKFPYEVIFRNVHKLLMDCATSEYLFCCDFFEEERVFKELFTPIISVIEGDLHSVVMDMWDLVGMLLMIRINHDHRRIMIKRRVPCLDDYLDRVHLLLWPRFKMLFDAHLQSVRAGSERQLFNDSVSVHYVVKRYAALSCSMLQLMAEYDSEDAGAFKVQGFTEMMDRLWAAIFDLLLRMSNLFKDRRQGIIFLITNYNHVINVLRQADAAGAQAQAAAAVQAQAGAAGAAGAQAQAAAAVQGRPSGIGKTGAVSIKDCEDQLMSCTNLYVEDQLGQHFPMLLEFVKKAEQQQKRLAVPEGQPIPNFTPPQAVALLRDFASRWQGAIEAMNREVMKHFSETSCGRDVLQASMTALLKYYTRLLELLKKQGPDGQQLAKDAPNIPAIMYEIKRITKM